MENNLTFSESPSKKTKGEGAQGVSKILPWFRISIIVTYFNWSSPIETRQKIFNIHRRYWSW